MFLENLLTFAEPLICNLWTFDLSELDVGAADGILEFRESSCSDDTVFCDELICDGVFGLDIVVHVFEYVREKSKNRGVWMLVGRGMTTCLGISQISNFAILSAMK